MNGRMEKGAVSLEEKDDGMSVCFGRANAEFASDDRFVYGFDKKNAEKLKARLLACGCGPAREILEDEFGADFDADTFEVYCETNGIEYLRMTEYL